ncbi:MAG: pilus assembly protein PilM [Armatimonadetes bacterium]|nr:pilus assembly protein PilM [Armatimonadota bacterium]
MDAPAAAGGAFDFGLKEPAAEAGPPDVQFDEGTFDFGDQADLPKVGAVGSTAPNADETTFEFAFAEDSAPEPKAQAGPDTTFDFDLAAPAGDDDDDDGASFAFDLADEPAAPAAVVPPAASSDAGAEESFTFDFGAADAAPAATSTASGPEASADETFMFDFGESEPAATSPSTISASAATSSGVGSTEAGPDSSFDFQFDVPDAGSSMATPAPAKADPAGATDVGSSYDLGFLASDEGASGTSGESLDLAFSSSPGPAPAAEGSDDLDLLSPEDEERLRVREVMEPVVRDLAQEVARSLEYYQSQYEGAVVDKVVLVGGSARIEGLAEFFEAELGLTVEEGRPLEGIALSAKLPAEDVDRDEPVLAVAVGLAMRGLM